MKITDDMLSAQATEARELWLQACTPDALPEHRFSRKFRREMRRLVRAQKHSAAFNRSLRLARRTAAVLLRDERRGIPRIAYQYCRARV